MFATPNPSGLEDISYRRYGKQRNPGVLLGRVDVEIFNLPKLRPLRSTQASHNGDALIALFQRTDGCAADRRCGRIRNVGVRYTDDVRAVRINLNPHLGAIGRPIISHHSNAWRLL